MSRRPSITGITLTPTPRKSSCWSIGSAGSGTPNEIANGKSEEFRSLSPSKGILAFLVLLVGIGVVLAVAFLTQKEENASTNLQRI